MRAIAYALAASAALVGAYLALGGASYAPAQVADPCAPRDWREPQGFDELGEQIVLSALDGAACELGSSREAMVLALANRDALERFARRHNIGNDEFEELLRAGFVRAIDDAERADRLDDTTADLLRGIARRMPVSELLDLLEVLPGGL